MSRITPEQIIEGIKKRDNTVLQYVYKSYYPIVLKFVVKNKGSEDDAKDIFQETLVTLFKNLRDNPDFELNCNFQTYIYSVARVLWLKSLKNTKINGFTPLIETHSYIHFTEPEPFREEDIQYSIYQKAFLKLPADCRDILKMTIDGFSQKEIVDILKLYSENYVRKRKHFCKEYLIKLIKEDPQFQDDTK